MNLAGVLKQAAFVELPRDLVTWRHFYQPDRDELNPGGEVSFRFCKETDMTAQTDTRPKCLAIVMEGGLVQSVVSDVNLPDLDVLVIDYGTKGASPEHLVSVPQADGGSATAWSSFYAIERATIDLAAVVRQLTEITETQP